MEQLTTEQPIENEGSKIRKIRKNNRLFVLFLIIDLIIVGLIVYEIIALVHQNQEAQKAAEEAANTAVNALKFLI